MQGIKHFVDQDGVYYRDENELKNLYYNVKFKERRWGYERNPETGRLRKRTCWLVYIEVIGKQTTL